MTIDQYHADHTRASKSALDILNRCPLEYYYRKIETNSTNVPAHVRQKWDDSSDRHFDIGNAVDCLLLEPDDFLSKRFFVLPRVDRRTTAGRNAFNSACLDNAGKRWITEQEKIEIVEPCVKAVQGSWLSVFIDANRSQNTFHWEDPHTGILCKCRPDWMLAVDADFWERFSDAFGDQAQWWMRHLRKECALEGIDEVVFDLKTLHGRWEAHVVDYRYHVQNAFYLDGIDAAMADGKRRMFAFLVVNTEWPHAVTIKTLPEEAVRIGRSEYQRNLETLRECRETGNWPRGGDDWSVTEMPSWFMWRHKNLVNI